MSETTKEQLLNKLAEARNARKLAQNLVAQNELVVRVCDGAIEEYERLLKDNYKLKP